MRRRASEVEINHLLGTGSKRRGPLLEWSLHGRSASNGLLCHHFPKRHSANTSHRFLEKMSPRSMLERCQRRSRSQRWKQGMSHFSERLDKRIQGFIKNSSRLRMALATTVREASTGASAPGAKGPMGSSAISFA